MQSNNLPQQMSKSIDGVDEIFNTLITRVGAAYLGHGPDVLNEPDRAKAAAKQALYSLLASEAVYADIIKIDKNDKRVPYVVKAIPLTKLAELFGIKEDKNE